jgi:Protein of unknown function (DUF1552)
VNRTRPNGRVSGLSRRHILLGAGAGALALPFFNRVPSAHAQSFPTRVLFFYTPQEPIARAYWEPTAGFSLPSVMAPLEPHKQDLTIIGDMVVASADDDVKAGHNLIGHILTNQLNSIFGQDWQFYGGGISLDQYIAQQLGDNALVLGVSCDQTFGTTRLSYFDKDQPVHPEQDPAAAFDSTFANFLLPEDELAKLRDKRGRVLDVVNEHLVSLRGKVSVADRDKLDIHLDQIAKLEDKLMQGGALACGPTAPAALDASDNANIPATTRHHIDVMVQALACDVTRVGTLQVGGSGGFGTPQWPSEGIDINKGDHDIAHEYYSVNGAPEIADRVALETYHYRQLAYLLEQMKSVPEGDGTLLDHSVVVWVKSMSHNHNHDPIMMMLAGGANGQLTGGKYVNAGGAPTANLLVTVANLMGLNDSTFGNPAYCTGALSV